MNEHTARFISTLIWQAIIVVTILLFSQELQNLLGRIAGFKAGGAEIVFQKAVSETPETASVDSPALELRDAAGFFSLRGVMELVNAYPRLDPDEKATRGLLALETSQQHTWLVATQKRVFFILDDKNTREAKNLIQISVPLNDALEVDTALNAEGAPVFRIGSTGFWYYSRHRLGDPKVAAEELKRFLRGTG